MQINKIYNISTNSTTSTAGAVTAILVSSGTATTVVNNIVGDIRAQASTGTDVVRGISVTATSTLSEIKVDFNTVYLNASSSGANFGSTGIFHTTSTTATTTNLTLRNNIIVNASTANGTGLS